MPEIVTATAQIKCAGAVPPGLSVLNVLPTNMVSSTFMPMATIVDHIPANIHLITTIAQRLLW
ncbi:MAG: hypothetical protein ACI94Y_004018 [Maribacter sp.]|jgi:hypothetical protein